MDAWRSVKIALAIAWCTGLLPLVGGTWTQFGCVRSCEHGFWYRNCTEHYSRTRTFDVHDHMPGDVEFMTFLPLHRRFTFGIGCNDLDGLRAIEMIEAVRVATKHINRLGILGRFTVGADVFDSCSSPIPILVDGHRKLLAAFGYPCQPQAGRSFCEFPPEDPITPFLDQAGGEGGAARTDDEDSYGASGADYRPSPPIENVCFRKTRKDLWRAGGVRRIIIGPSSNDLALTSTAFFGKFQYVQISYGADAAELSSRQNYPTFFRTVPVVEFQSEAVAALLESLEARHFAVFASDDFGEGVLKSTLLHLRRKSSMGTVCAALSGLFSKDDSEGISSSLEKVQLVKLKVIVLLSTSQHAMAFLRKAAQKNMTGYVWIGTNKWTSSAELRADSQVVDLLGQSRVFSISPAPPKGSYVLEHWHKLKRHVQHRLRNLTPSPAHLGHNAWLMNAWEQHFECKLTKETSADEITVKEGHPHATSYACELYRQLKTNQAVVNGGGTVCPPGLRFDDTLLLPDEIRLIMHTFFVATEATRQILEEGCVRFKAYEYCPNLAANVTEGNAFKIKPKWMRTDINCAQPFDKVLAKLTEMNLTGQDRSKLAFGIAHLNFSAEKPEFHREVALWFPDGLNWTTNDSGLRKVQGHNHSICSPTVCPAGTEQVYPQDVSTHVCCFLCRKCTGNKTRLENSTGPCKACPHGHWPNQARSRCERIVPEYHTAWNLTWCLVVTSFSMIFCLTALIGAELNYAFRSKIGQFTYRYNVVVLLIQAGVLFLKFLVMLSPTDSVCIAQLLLLWPWPAALYGGFLLVKSNHFRKLSGSTKRPIFSRMTVSTRCEVLLWILLASGTILIIVLWAAISTPEKEVIYHSDGTAVLRCTTSMTWIKTYYGLTLSVLTSATALTFLTRAVPSNFSESKYVFVTSFFTTLFWVLFLPSVFIQNNLSPSTLIALISLFQDVVFQICLFARPIYYIAFDLVDGNGSFRRGSSSEMTAAHRRGSQASTFPMVNELPELEMANTNNGPQAENTNRQTNARPTLYLEDDTTTKNGFSASREQSKLEESAVEVQKPFAEVEMKESLFDSGVPPDDADQLELVMFNGHSPEPTKAASNDQ